MRAAGIVDELGGVDETIAEAAKLAGLDDDYDLDWIEQDRSWRDALVLQLRRTAARAVDATSPHRAQLPTSSRSAFQLQLESQRRLIAIYRLRYQDAL